MKNALILSALLTLGPVCFAQTTEKTPQRDEYEWTSANASILWAIMKN